MSTNITTTIGVDVEGIEIDTNTTDDLITTNQHYAEVEALTSIISGSKQEYSVVGDALYASVSMSEAPEWLTSIIDGVVGTAVSNGMGDYATLVQEVRNAIDSIDVARNTYVEQININALVDGIVTTRLETLNATLGDTYATRVALTAAMATSELASTTHATDIVATLNADVNSRITNVETAYAAADQSLATSVTALNNVLVDQAGDISGSAGAISSLQTYVGLSPTSTPDGTGALSNITSLSTSLLALDNAVHAPDGSVALGLSALEVANKAYTDDSVVGVENKFAYDSTITLGGKTYQAGFGLDSLGTSNIGTPEDPVFDSTFRVNAERFALTSPSHPGVSAVFNVTATGLLLSLDQTEATRNEAKGSHPTTAIPAYVKGDMVTSGGSSYVALKDVPASTAITDTSYWQLLASRGSESITVNIHSTEGTVFRNDTGTTVLKANVDIGGTLQDDTKHGQYSYNWTIGEDTLCVDGYGNVASDGLGNIYTDIEGATCQSRGPYHRADSSNSTASINFRQITLSADDIGLVETIRLSVSNIPE